MEPTAVLVPRESPSRPLALWQVPEDWQMSLHIWSRLFLNFCFSAESQDGSVCMNGISVSYSPSGFRQALWCRFQVLVPNGGHEPLVPVAGESSYL